MEHNCTLQTLRQENIKPKEFKWFLKYTLISIDNPRRLSNFSSETAVREEKIRQSKISCWVIHPFSRFRAWYDVYLIYLYASVLFTKPLDAAFIKADHCSRINLYLFYNAITDFLCWIDIILNFITGYQKENGFTIELRKPYIAVYYVCSPYFICDVLSSIPKCIIYALAAEKMATPWERGITGIASILGLFKIVRIFSLVKCIWRAAAYFQYSSRELLILIGTISGSLMVLHWLTCMQMAIPRLFRISFPKRVEKTSWFYSTDLYNGTLYTNQNIFVRYNHCLFKCSAYILGIRTRFYDLDMSEEYVLAIVTYFIGKIIIAFVWVSVAMAIINDRAMELNFAELISELHEYMKHKQLPMNLRSRILQHFRFKYRKKYFEEEWLTGFLSDNLKKEANMHTCKYLIENASLFRKLSPIETSKLVQYLVPEIYLANDIIIKAGTHGNAMYFLSTGTVAVYTRSGREVCHLQDGAYFGEISLVLKSQLRSASVKALETSFVFRLHKKDLQRHLLSNEKVMRKILKNAQLRLREITKTEEQYKKQLFKDFKELSHVQHEAIE